MISKKDFEVLVHLRKNARKKVTEISREMHIPVTTLYDKIRAHEKKGIVKKHVALIDFSKLGFYSRAVLALTVSREKKQKLQDYLFKHPSVNSLYRVDSEHEFILEVVFENQDKLQEFIDEIDVMFSLDQIKTFNILQELKKEEFLDKIPVNMQ